MSNSKFLSVYGLFVMVCGYVITFLPNAVPSTSTDEQTALIVGAMTVLFGLNLIIKSGEMSKDGN